MNLVSHHSFDDRQQALTAAILEAIVIELKKVDAPGELVEQLTGSIAFAVTSLLDDSASVEFSGGNLAPMLTFQVANEELAYAGGNSWMHEYVYRLLPAAIGRVVDTGDA
jgi:hypothetical protein